MSERILFIGIDAAAGGAVQLTHAARVDDNAFHGCAFYPTSGEVVEFKTRPHRDGLVKKLAEVQKKFPGSTIKCCYEATYIGFTLEPGPCP